MDQRKLRVEEIKIGQEAEKIKIEKKKLYLGIVTLLGTVIGVGVALNQWSVSNRQYLLALETNKRQALVEALASAATEYRSTVNEWREHNRVFVTHPELYPFFAENRPASELAPDKRSLAFSIADSRLEALSHILILDTLAYDHLRRRNDLAGTDVQVQESTWKEVAVFAFRRSILLCARFLEFREIFGGRLEEIGRQECLDGKQQ